MNNDSQWDKVAESYSQSVGDRGDLYHQNYLNPVVDELVGGVDGLEVLDLACGNGYYSRKLAKQGGKLTGVDASSLLLNKAKERESKEPLGINYVLCSVADMKDVSDDTFDLVVCNVSLHDIEDLENTLSEVSRVLKAGGRFIFSIPHPCFSSSKREQDEKGFYQKIRFYLRPRSYRRAKFGDTYYYHRPLSMYVNTLVKNSLLIKEMREISTHRHSSGQPLPDDSLLRDYKQEIPTFLVVETSKLS